MNKHHTFALVSSCTALLAGGSGAVADFDWVVVGDPGNPGFEGGPIGQLKGRGTVDYLYRVSQTEVTVSQWFEFVQAYGPFAGDQANSFVLLGLFIIPTGGGEYEIVTGKDNLPTNMSWRMAARYVNWLHNDKEITQEAFESGVYDTSTFTENPDGSFNDQPTHSADARFWIPTLDEWMKATYYDPLLDNGLGGWWQHPASTNEVMVVGPPGVGQTNASAWAGPNPLFSLDVGLFTDVQSPWGLLDASGGMMEWTEEFSDSSGTRRVAKGSSFFSDDFGYPFEDHILWDFGWHVDRTFYQGLRISAVVPGPSAWGVVACGLFIGPRRRRERAALSGGQPIRFMTSITRAVSRSA